MLTRQRVVASMLHAAGGRLSSTSLVKWCFLLRHGMPSGGGSAFYEFVPYHYGPFSFGLYQEAGRMVSNAYLREPDRNVWEVTTAGVDAAQGLAHEIQADISKIATGFGRDDAESVRRYVYRRFPWFTINSKIERHVERPHAPPAAYTVGYEGQQIDGFLNTLLRHGMDRVLDVRHNPVARRYGFHKKTLTRLLSNLDIEYVHIPELGIRSENRRGLTSQSDYEDLFDEYEVTTLVEQGDALAMVADLQAEKASALLCMEADPVLCHRARVATAVAEMSGLPVHHLGG